MGVKGINPLEAHCEKIVVGLAGAALVGVVVWQFAGPKPTVQLSGKPYVLTEAYGELERRAVRVKGQIEGPGSVDSLPAADMPLGLLADAGDFSTTTVSPSPTLAIGFGTAGIPVEGGLIAPGDSQGIRFAEITPPAPSKPMAAQTAATIHPQEIELNEGLANLVAEPGRPDLVAVSVESTWSVADFLNLLQLDPDGPEGPIQPLPGVWWNGPDMALFDVELIRQKLAADGSWGEEEPVANMPGRLELRTEMAEAGQEFMTGDQMRQWADQASQFATEIRRPHFYAIVYGDDWAPPSEVDPLAGVAVENPDEKRARRELEGVRNQMANLEKRLAELGGGGGRGEGGGHGGGGRGTPTGGGRQDDSQRQQEQNERQRQALERQLESLRSREQAIIDRLLQMGAKNIPGVEQVDAMAGQPAMPTEAEADPPLLESDEIRIWAHDVQVERGATYRYKLRVWVTNPFFGHDAGLTSEQKSLAASPLLAGEASEWTDPVHVHDEAYYFITSAQEGGLTAGARAIASVYVFRWGYWREGTARMEPGDALATTVQSPMLGEVLAAVEVQPGIGGQPGGERGHGGGHMLPGGPAQIEEVPAGPDVEYEPIQVRRDVVLLDVGPAMHSTGEKVAYLREETGSIVDRDPQAETRRDIFMVLQSSARRGREALQPKEVAPAAPAPDRMPPPEGPGQMPPRSPLSPKSPGGG